MKKQYLGVLSLLFVSLFLNAQNKFKENEPFQQTLHFNITISKEKALAYFITKQGLDSFNSFTSSKETSDESGLVHQRHQQFYKGIKVEFGTLITHVKSGTVVSINAELYNASSLNLTPSITAMEGLNKAVTEINASKYLWQDEAQSQIVNYQKPQGELVIFPIIKTGEVKLAYKYDIYAIEPVSRQEVFVDAHDGHILFKNPIIKHATNIISQSNDTPEINKFETLITGNANTKYSGLRSIETRFDTPLNQYVLNDVVRGSQIVTYNCERIVNTYQNVHFTDNDNDWTLAEHANAFFDNAAQDAHWGAEMTYDFWKTTFNRNGFDDNNGLIKSYVHFKQTTANLNNAYWNGSFMTYGDGSSRPYTSIDICGHEIGHAICTYTANLAYQNHSGAMNEGFSDIWGACIEHFGRTGSLTGTPSANVWKIGEDTTAGGTGFRSMATPLTFGDPDTFRGTNWVVTAEDGSCTPTTANDHCGVHANSGVMNHWFYILTAGASGTNNAPVAERDTYNVTGIGMVKSSQIAYYTERDYLTPNSNFYDMREFSIVVANNLYCSSGPEVIAVTNAWFAVNIGINYANILNDVSLDSIPSNNSINCGVTSVSPTIYFKNLGTNPITQVNISYNIDGGPNTNLVWNGNLSTCSMGSQQITVNTSGLSVGTHLLNFTTTIAGDVFSSNNSKSTYIFVNQSGAINQVNGFESSTDNLLASDEVVSTTPLWQRGIINKTNLTSAIADNSNVYATGLNDVYPSDTKSYLTSRCYDLSQTANPILKFDMAFDLQYSGDILYMQYSLNGGSTWSLLGSQSDPNWYTTNTGCPFCIGGEWTGDAGSTNISGSTNGTKRLYSYNLSSFGSLSSTPQSNILFRFVFQSDALDNYDGVFIDNFVVESGVLGNEEFSSTSISIYPNPAGNVLNYSIKNNVEISTIKINDISGKDVYTNVSPSMTSIDISSLASGVYFITFKSDTNLVTKKFIKQ
jgi:Zn-dependent metalloprotease